MNDRLARRLFHAVTVKDAVLPTYSEEQYEDTFAYDLDIQPLELTRRNLAVNYPQLADRVQFVSTDGSLGELGDERFDVVISKDSFEQIMLRTGLRLRYFPTNASDTPVVRAMDLVSRLAPLREYFTANVYGIWENVP